MNEENKIDATEPVPGQEQIKKVETDEVETVDLDQVSGGVIMIDR